MAHFLLLVHDRLERFERWFEQRFGWFFTNGMKTRPRHPFTGGSRQHR